MVVSAETKTFNPSLLHTCSLPLNDDDPVVTIVVVISRNCCAFDLKVNGISCSVVISNFIHVSFLINFNLFFNQLLILIIHRDSVIEVYVGTSYCT